MRLLRIVGFLSLLGLCGCQQRTAATSNGAVLDRAEEKVATANRFLGRATASPPHIAAPLAAAAAPLLRDARTSAVALQNNTGQLSAAEVVRLRNLQNALAYQSSRQQAMSQSPAWSPAAAYVADPGTPTGVGGGLTMGGMGGQQGGGGGGGGRGGGGGGGGGFGGGGFNNGFASTGLLTTQTIGGFSTVNPNFNIQVPTVVPTEIMRGPLTSFVIPASQAAAFARGQ